ncbi:hypothetical protein HDU93_005048 [Gonapodya sp. JEL0774]|nr:hypothetical protein HDU93_005048 [Gonapodya sp. JEL0774]
MRGASVQWRADRERAFRPGDRLTSWVVLNTARGAHGWQDKATILRDALRSFGLDVNDPVRFDIDGRYLEEEFKDKILKTSNERGAFCQLAVVIIDRKPSPIYGALKTIALTDANAVSSDFVGLFSQISLKWSFIQNLIQMVPTQVLVWDKLRNQKSAYYANVAIKINAKIGGTAWVLPQQEFPTQITSEPTMVVGIALSHAPPGHQSPSVVGLAHSVDRSLTRYSAVVRGQEARRATVDLEPLMQKAFEQVGKAFSPLPLCAVSHTYVP